MIRDVVREIIPSRSLPEEIFLPPPIDVQVDRIRAQLSDMWYILLGFGILLLSMFLFRH